MLYKCLQKYKLEGILKPDIPNEFVMI